MQSLVPLFKEAVEWHHRTRVCIDGEQFKIAVGGGCWTPGYGKLLP